jgi:hypothetical protein
MPEYRERASMRRIRSYWKQLLVSAVFLVAFATFLQSSMVGTAPDRVPRALYYAVSLFILGGLDIGLPHDQSTSITLLLWLCYFLAPLLTASYLYDFVQKTLLDRIPRRIQGHTILCGLGRNGHLIYELIRENFPANHKLVIIEKSKTNPYIPAVERDPHTWLIQSDFTRLPVLQSARVGRAKRIIFSTNLDLDNLNAVMELQSHGSNNPGLSVHCHLGDPEMLDNLQHTLFREETYKSVHVYNGYQCATRQLYQRMKEGSFFGGNGTVFILFGYGRFAHMLFSQITQDSERTGGDEIIIVTEKMSSGYDLERLRYGYSRDTQSTPCKIQPPLFMDMHNPGTWAQIEQMLAGDSRPVLAFLCRDNDVANMDLAISVKLKGPACLRKATFVCRMYGDMVQDLNEMLDHRITPSQTRDIILFPLQAELKKAFLKELFADGRP